MPDKSSIHPPPETRPAPGSRDPQVLQAAAREWLRRVEAEYTSSARTHAFVGWLLRAAAPPELIRAGLRIVDDELEHATLSAQVVADTGAPARPELQDAQLGLTQGRATLLEDLTYRCLEIFCLGETVAVPLFVHMRKQCVVPSARSALDRIVVDEVRHRDFGWEMLDWLCSVDEANTRARAQEFLPTLFVQLRKNYLLAEAGGAALGSDQSFMPAARDWGLIPASEYGPVLARCFERDYLPRFSKRGIDAAAAWSAGS